MENKISTAICCYLLKNKIITYELFDVYVYGTELLLSFIISTTIILCIGLITRQLFYSIVFLIIFIFLRRYTGGYHAKTYLLCKIFTIGTFIMVLLLSNLISIDIVIYLLLTFPGLIVIGIWSPIENTNKPLSINKKKKHKFISIILYIIILALGAISITSLQTLGNVICHTLTSIIVLMLLAITERRFNK